MSSPNFLDELVVIFQNAIATAQESTQLKSENAHLKDENEQLIATNTDLQTKLNTATSEGADLQTRLDATTASLNADEAEKADTATKLATLQQLSEQLKSIAPPIAVSTV